MAKKADEKKNPPSPADRTTITCKRVDRDLLARVAGVRNESLEEFLGSHVLREFLRHLLIDALRKETEQKADREMRKETAKLEGEGGARAEGKPGKGK